MNKQKFLELVARTTVSNNWDLPTPGRELDLSRKYFGPDSEQRENLKKAGRKLQESMLGEEMLLGYGLEAKAHYYRSLEAATNQSRVHPNRFEEYFAHWVHSDSGYFPIEVYKLLSKWFPCPKIIKIKKGGSYWRSRTQQAARVGRSASLRAPQL
jgi:hypothetical protein